MALVTYRGPRPELTPSFPVPLADFIDRDGEIQIITYQARPRGAQYVGHQTYALERDRPTPVGALFALGLAMIRRRPSPWMTVKFARGEFAEVAHRVNLLQDFWVGNDEEEWTRWGHRQQVLSYLHWTQGHVDAFYAGEWKPLFVNGDLVWAPEGWKEILVE